MLRSIFAALAIAAVASACVTVGPTATIAPTTSSTAGAPSLGIATPVTPTSAPSAPPVATPTAQVTSTPLETVAGATPSLEPSIGTPSVEPSSGIGERDLLFDDTLDDPTSGWDELNLDFASISYDSGVLAFRYNDSGSWAYTVRELDAPETVVQPIAQFSPQSAGIFGLLCGDTLSGEYFGAVVDVGGGVRFIEVVGDTVTVLDRLDKLGLVVNVATTNGMALRCHADGLGALSLESGLSNTGPVAVYHQDSGAPINFDIVGMYAEAQSDGYSLTVSEAAAFGVGDASGTLSSGAQELLSHVPSDLQQGCFESPVFADDASYELTCILQRNGKGAEIAQFEQFDTKEQMDAAYEQIVDTFGSEDATSCSQGPHQTTWQLGDTDLGLLVCAYQAVGIRFDWTDDRLNIFSTLVDLDGSFSNTYEQWARSGLIE